jgi:hypothetical protein
MPRPPVASRDWPTIHIGAAGDPANYFQAKKHRTTAVKASRPKENIMLTFNTLGRNTQRALCMLVSVLIVAGSFSFGEYKTQAAMHKGYSVTITQLS